MNYYDHIKSCIDTIYELTKEGYVGSMGSLGDTILMKVSTELVNRGVVKKDRLKGSTYKYTWVATSAPTETFYKNILTHLRSYQKGIDAKNRALKKSKFEVKPAVESVVVKIDSFSTQELWDELKRRGAVIENNQLVIVTKVALV